MNRPSFFGLALAATALLVVSAADARASAPAPLPIEGVAPAEAPSASAQPAPATPTVPTPIDPSGGTTATSTPPAATPATPATGQATPAAPTLSQGAGAAPPTAGEVVPATTPGTETPGSGAQAGVVANSVRTTGTQADVPAAGRITASAPPSAAIAPSAAPSGDVHPAATAGQSGVILERALPAVERRLRGVQTQMSDLQRRLAMDGSASSSSLVRLRQSLELIAPALVAIGVQVDDTGPLSPHLRQLLDRVNTRLGDANASAAALAAALRRSGVRGPEVARLLRELEDFQALSPGFLSNAQLAGAQPVYAAHVAYTLEQTVPAAAPAPAPPAHRAAAPQRSVAAATASQQPAAPEELVPQASASGSASAGPGGAFSAAGIAALAALLGVLALPRLLSRVQLAPMRCYAAVFLVPLQRPG